MPDDIDAKIAALRNYIRTLHAAEDSADSLDALTAITDQIMAALQLSQALAQQKFQTDDETLAASRTTINNSVAALRAFRGKVDTWIKDVAIAAKVVGAFAQVAHLIPGLPV
ncbi:MAG: hypothetical protein JSR21_11160 [Proteobacteria bacterium]|nr:hypothetical protein [Pseudomonadota bacterium]